MQHAESPHTREDSLGRQQKGNIVMPLPDREFISMGLGGRYNG